MKKLIKLLLVSVGIYMVSCEANMVRLSDVESKYASNLALKATIDLEQNIDFGYSSTSGNTNISNFNGKYKLAYTTIGYDNEILKIALRTYAFMSKNNGVKKNEEFAVKLGLEQHIMKGWEAYMAVDWMQNKFLNFTSKFSIGAGVGKELINDGKHIFKVKLGLSYNKEKYLKLVNNQKDKSFMALNEYFEYKEKINKFSKIYLKVGALQNLNNITKDYEVLAVVGLRFAVAENISMTMERELRYDSIPAGKEKVDTKTIARVGYRF